MTSGKAARRQRQQAVARPPVRSTGGRRANPWVVGGALAAIAAIVVIALIVLSATGGNGSSSSNATGTALPDAATIQKQFAGIPQQGNVLGKATAPATLVQYIDLQCPVCREFETSVMPTVIDRYVRTGKLKVITRPVTVIGPDSERGRLALIAAFAQNRGFNFAQLLYFNQGPENGGWLDDSMVADAAASIPGVDVKTLQDAAKSKAVADQTAKFDQQAQADQLAGTPTILVGKTGGQLTNLGAGVPSIGTLSTLINKAQ